MWSLGVIVYTLLCGKWPFDGNDVDDLKENIINKNPDYSRELWGKVSL